MRIAARGCCGPLMGWRIAVDRRLLRLTASYQYSRVNYRNQYHIDLLFAGKFKPALLLQRARLSVLPGSGEL